MKNFVLGLCFAIMALFGNSASAGENWGKVTNNLNVPIVIHGTNGWQVLQPGQSAGGIASGVDIDGAWIPNNGIPTSPGVWVKIPGLNHYVFNEGEQPTVGPPSPSNPRVVLPRLTPTPVGMVLHYETFPVTPTTAPFPNTTPSDYAAAACPEWIRLIYPYLIPPQGPPAPPPGGGGIE
jgi:hypothetical protein